MLKTGFKTFSKLNQAYIVLNQTSLIILLKISLADTTSSRGP